MSASSVPRRRKALSRSNALSCVVINQFATPGLGSIVGGRRVSGAVQLLLALAGFFLLLVWMFYYFYDRFRVSVGHEPVENAYGSLGKWGLVLFGIAWVWALVTSLSLLRQAKTEGGAGKGRVPPRIAVPPGEPSEE